MKAAAIYARVSTADQVSGTSLDSQVATCREYAGQHGYTVIEAAVVTEDISGTVFNRPGIKKLQEMAERKEIDAVVLAKVDRLARGRVVDALLESELRALGVSVLYVNRDTATPEGRLLVNIEKDFAEWERERILERTWAGRVSRARQGRVMGSWAVPYGYNFIQGEGRFEVIEGETQWVRQMFNWFVNERCSIGEITRRLCDLGVPTKHRRPSWQRGTVHKMLTNSMYVGDWYWNKTQQSEPKKPHKAERTTPKSSHIIKPREEWIHIPVTPIVSRDVFEAAARQLQRNKEKAGRPGPRRDLLKSMLVCSLCGRRLSGYEMKDRNRKRPYTRYRCGGKLRPVSKDRCHSPSITAHKLEADLWEKITAYLTNEDEIMDTLRKREAGREGERERDAAQLEALYATEAEIKRQRHKLLDLQLAEPPVIDRETAQERTADLDKRAKELQAAKVAVEARMRSHQGATGGEAKIREACAQAREGISLVTEEDKREFLELAELRGVVEAKRVVFTWIISDPITVFLGKLAGTEEPKLYNVSGGELI